MPPAFSTVAIAAVEARETTIWRGCVRGGWASKEEECRCEEARSLTPSPMQETHLERARSRMVMGREGSMRRWAIQDWIRERGRVVRLTEKLVRKSG